MDPSQRIWVQDRAGPIPRVVQPELVAHAVAVRLCRLRYLGDAKDGPWSPSGWFEVTTEEAFDCSAGVYLRE